MTYEPDTEQAQLVENMMYLMTVLDQSETGLPMLVFVSPKDGARHDVRIKVNPTHGPHMDICNASVGVRPVPEVKEGTLSGKDREAVFEWIELNQDVLVRYWNYEINTTRLMRDLQII